MTHGKHHIQDISDCYAEKAREKTTNAAPAVKNCQS